MYRGPESLSRQRIEMTALSTPPERAPEVDESGAAIAEWRGRRPSADSDPLRSTKALVRAARYRSAGADWSLGSCPARAAHYFCVLVFSCAGKHSLDVRAVGTCPVARTGARFGAEHR